jgi:hypothetical protein
LSRRGKKGEIHRGSVMKISTLEEIRRRVGQVMTFSQFASVSTSPAIAEGFLNHVQPPGGRGAGDVPVGVDDASAGGG